MLLSLSEKRPFLWVVILGVMLGVWVPKDGQSGCDPVSLPYFEDFEGTGFHFFSTSYSRAWEGPPRTGKKKGGIKVNKVIRVQEGVASYIRFTSAATSYSIMLASKNFERALCMLQR
jgi:hypothetical protein